MKIIVEFESPEDKSDEKFEFKLLKLLPKLGKFRVINKILTEQVTFDKIEKAVCKETGITPKQLQLKTRKQEIVEARQLCHHISMNNRKKLGSPQKIADRFGKKDHSCVYNSDKKIKGYLETSSEFRNKYKPLIESFNHDAAKIM